MMCRRLVTMTAPAALLRALLVGCTAHDFLSTDELENYISPDDLAELSKMDQGLGGPNGLKIADNVEAASTPEGIWVGNRFWDSVDYDDIFSSTSIKPRVPKEVNCFGVSTFSKMSFIFNLRPASKQDINTHFFFSSRKHRDRVQVYSGDQFGLEWVDFDAKRQSVVIVHGFMSHSNASWVRNLTNAFLDWNDVNVITVDWSGGGNTWKYWRAVANTRQVGADLTLLLEQLMASTGCEMRNFHFVGHSLGAHICSYAASHVGGVRRITGLDPAQPCFTTRDKSVLLDASDAEFVDVIHTNGRLLKRLGLGMPDPSGHADFYPNGGMKQPGCYKKQSFFSKLIPISPTKLSQAICSHGRAYVLFTESLLSKNCTFRAHSWNMTLQGVNASLQAACDHAGSCSEMGIRADGVLGGAGDAGGVPRARGPYFVLTADTRPFCPSEYFRHHPNPLLLRDLAHGFHLDRTRNEHATTALLRTARPDAGYAEPPPDLARACPPVGTATPTTHTPFWKFW